MILSKQQALKRKGRKFITIPIPELEGEMRLGTLMAGASMAAQALGARREKGEDVTREIALLILESSAVDEAGAPLFTHDEAVEFIDQVATPETLALVLKSFPRASGAETKLTAEEVAGNSAASPSGA